MAKKIDFKYSKKAFSNSLTYRLTLILDIVLTIFCILMSLLYVLGNFQSFLDNTQTTILIILSYTSMFTALLSLFLLVETIIKIFTEKRKLFHIIIAVYLLISAILSMIFSGSSNIISALSSGSF